MAAADSITIPVLPFINGSGLVNIANVTCDSGKARIWNIGLGGSALSGEQVRATNLVVDNSSNASSCYVNFNTFRFSVSPFTRKSFKLPDNQVSISLTVGVGAVALTISDADLGIPDDSSQYGQSGVAGALDKSQFDASTATNGVTVDNTGFVATFAGGTNACVLSRTNKTFGKYYLEIDFDTTKSNGLAIVPYQNLSQGSQSGSQSTGIFWNCPSQSQLVNIYVNGSLKASLNGAFQANKIKVAIDIDNARMWFADRGTSSWNGATTNDPTMPGTGLDCSPIFPVFKKFNFEAAGNAAGTVTVNTGASPFADTPPVGYTAGW